MENDHEIAGRHHGDLLELLMNIECLIGDALEKTAGVIGGVVVGPIISVRDNLENLDRATVDEALCLYCVVTFWSGALPNYQAVFLIISGLLPLAVVPFTLKLWNFADNLLKNG